MSLKRKRPSTDEQCLDEPMKKKTKPTSSEDQRKMKELQWRANKHHQFLKYLKTMANHETVTFAKSIVCEFRNWEKMLTSYEEEEYTVNKVEVALKRETVHPKYSNQIYHYLKTDLNGIRLLTDLIAQYCRNGYQWYIISYHTHLENIGMTFTMRNKHYDACDYFKDNTYYDARTILEYDFQLARQQKAMTYPLLRKNLCIPTLYSDHIICELLFGICDFMFMKDFYDDYKEEFLMTINDWMKQEQ